MGGFEVEKKISGVPVGTPVFGDVRPRVGSKNEGNYKLLYRQKVNCRLIHSTGVRTKKKKNEEG